MRGCARSPSTRSKSSPCRRADGTFTYANEAVVRYLGYSVSELLGRNAAEFLHPDDAEAMRERFRGFLDATDSQPELNRFEYRFRHRDGSWCWLESVAVNALANPAVLGIIAHSRDINRRKANERILSLNHARYRTVADLSEGAVYEYLMNAEGVYELEWTLRHRARLRLQRRGIPAPRLAELCRSATNGASRAWRAPSVTCAAKPWNSPRRSAASTARCAGSKCKNRPIADPATGKFTRLVGVAIDITERKQAADALRESEFRYRTVAELTSGFVYEATVDEHGEAQVVWASPGWEQFFGGTLRRAQSHRLAPRLSSQRSRRRDPAAPAAAPRRTHGDGAGAQDPARRERAGSTWPTSRCFRADGSVRRFIGVVHDITDRKANEEVLRSQALAIEVMHEGVVLSDSGGIIRMTNPAFDRMFRIVAGSLIGKHLDQLPCDPPLDRRIAESADEAAARAGAPLVSELTVRGANDGDSALFVEAAITSLVLRGERFWLTMLQDATARRQLEREVLEVSNREQQRIGNDLHDGLGQELTGIALLLRGLENRAERESPALSPSIEEVALLVNDAIFTTRALARGLSPVTFDRGGLVARARRARAAAVGDVSHRRALRSGRHARSRARVRERAAPVPHRAGSGDQCRTAWPREQRADRSCAATAIAGCCASRTTAAASTRRCTSRRGSACASCITARR